MRSDKLSNIFDLPVGKEYYVEPLPGEEQEAAFQRLKRRTAKYQADGKFYRLKIDGAGVVIQRIEKAQRGPLSDWLIMPTGTRLLLKSEPTDKDRKKAWQIAARLSSNFKESHESGFWHTLLDAQGRLVAERYVGLDGELLKGNGAGGRYTDSVPLADLWAGEWK
ncbi:hypothetical protein [Sphingomonas sp.]|jgi:hypothetical protein|uniref:hypothetical protein n=1 Tax=Sphingomonas sp. TaxID=28214 RepID=UPI002ED99B5C